LVNQKKSFFFQTVLTGIASANTGRHTEYKNSFYRSIKVYKINCL